jgi:hypothetical protein
MPRLKRFCTCLLAAVLLIPAISAHDDAIRLSAFQTVVNTQDESLVAVHLGKTDFDSTLATLLDGLDTIHIGNACIFSLSITFSPLLLIEESRGCNRSVAAPAGRAPPA